jgi:hypothetical protein
MGSGYWSASTYNDRAAARASTGKDAFDYSVRAKTSGILRPHQTLDPSGLQFRESRDNAEHPGSNAIIISLDVTGSMGKVVRGIHADLPRLLELLLGHKYVPDPQILFAAVGDATCDRVPFQIGQFESDNRMDQHLENMILEGGGGGQKTESYELMFYAAARHTAIDCYEKRNRKGYLFVIGDEMAYPMVKNVEVARVFGPGLSEDITLEQIIAEASKRYHLYFVIPGGASYGGDKHVLDFWNRHLGAQRVIHLDSPEDTSESIALTIGLNEGAIDMGQGVGHMEKRGMVARAIDRISRALGAVPSSGPTVVSNGPRKL